MLRFVICSESYGGRISDVTTAVVGKSEECRSAAAGLYAVNFVSAVTSVAVYNVNNTLCLKNDTDVAHCNFNTH